MSAQIAIEAPASRLETARCWPVSLLVVGAAAAAALAAVLAAPGHFEHATLLGGYFALDATSRLFLLLVNLVFLGVATYVWTRVRMAPRLREGIGRLVALTLGFMAAANLAIVSSHLLVGWLFLELTTLFAAPLVIRPGVRSSLLASWRYLLFSSVGLGLALLGFACVARSLPEAGPAVFFLDHLAQAKPSGLWLTLGVALLLLGYGTKLGLAPMYSWLPETYDEAPPAVTALLGAVQFNCALVGLFRVVQIARAWEPRLITAQLVSLGLLSMAVSALGIIATKNYKRLLAFASINHAGVIAIGLGIGHSASYGLLIYVVSNAFVKAILFLTAGEIKSYYRTKDMREISGLIKDLPYSGLFLMVGAFALLGLPPFGSFLGELLILSELVRADFLVVFTMFCILLTITFVATGRALFPMIWGEAKMSVSWPRQSFVAAVPKLVFLAAIVSMGIYLPVPINALFRSVAASLGGP